MLVPLIQLSLTSLAEIKTPDDLNIDKLFFIFIFSDWLILSILIPDLRVKAAVVERDYCWELGELIEFQGNAPEFSANNS